MKDIYCSMKMFSEINCSFLKIISHLFVSMIFFCVSLKTIFYPENTTWAILVLKININFIEWYSNSYIRCQRGSRLGGITL